MYHSAFVCDASPGRRKAKCCDFRAHTIIYSNMYICMYGHTYSKSMDPPGKVVNPARGQLNREN